MAHIVLRKGRRRQMKVIDHWLEYLTKSRVRFSHSIHPRAETALETATADRMRAHDLAKTVVYITGSGFGMVVVPADEFVDLGKVARLLGETHIRLANETELAELFPDCELGAMPPFGNHYGMRVIVDPAVARCEFIAFNLGTHRDTVRMSYADFERLASPAFASIAAPYEVPV